MAQQKWILLLLLAMTVPAIYGELLCHYTKTVKCGSHPDCECPDESEQEIEKSLDEKSCEIVGQRICLNNAICGSSGCECSPCYKGSNCSEAYNEHAPVFVVYADTSEQIEVEPSGKFEYSVSATDADKESCGEEITKSDCPCGFVNYRLTKDSDTFGINRESGALILKEKSFSLQAGIYELEVEAYDSMGKQTRKVFAVKALVPKKASDDIMNEMEAAPPLTDDMIKP